MCTLVFHVSNCNECTQESGLTFLTYMQYKLNLNIISNYLRFEMSIAVRTAIIITTNALAVIMKASVVLSFRYPFGTIPRILSSLLASVPD